mgnify:CR=1 FL=1
MSQDPQANQPTVQNPPPPAPTARPKNPCLAEAIQDAQLLLAFASQGGKDVDAAVVKTIVEAGSGMADGDLKNEQEIAFWNAYNLLAKKVAPVSVTSLKATLDSLAGRGSTVLFGVRIGGGSLARKAVSWYTFTAIVTLIFILMFQVYWLFGTSITTDIQKTRKEAAEIDVKLRTLQKATAQPVDRKVPPAEGRKAEDPDILVLKVQANNLSLRKETGHELLKLWSSPWKGFIPEIGSLNDDDPGASQAAEYIARFETALSMVEVLQRYILPLLYGLLGTCVWILRTLTTEIKERTYSEASNIGFRIRLYLGMLGGMGFAWFITPETADGLFKSLSPFALAFLAGYSVELLFTAMDRFLAAFNSKTPA